MSRLFQLPVELVEIIASFLPPEDLFNLRLTCCELSTKTFHYFTQEHFTIKQFFPSLYGLKALLAISKSRLRESLRTVVLGPHDFSSASLLELARDEKKQIQQGYLRYNNENQYMRQTGLDAIILQEAFANLPNCSTLEIRDYSRIKPGTDWFHPLSGYDFHPLSSYGQSQFSEVAAISNFREDTTTYARIFTIALHAAATAKLPLESAIINYKARINQSPPSLPSPRWFDPSDCSLKKLLRLHLCITCFAHIWEPRWADTVDSIVQFFILAPNINRLGLDLGFRRSGHLFLMGLANALDFGNITTLDLSRIFTDNYSIFYLFTRLSKISCLNLCGVEAYESMRDIFEFIRDKMQLKKISGRYLHQDGFEIVFKSPRSENGSDLSDCFCYEGPDIANFMNDLISSMVIGCKPYEKLLHLSPQD